MSSSIQLRQNINQHAIKNNISEGREKTLALSVRNAVVELVKTHPHILFKLILNSKANLPSYAIFPNLKIDFTKLSNENLIKLFRENYPELSNVLASKIEKGHINPDGSSLLCLFNGKWKPILFSEHKHQGTNDQREMEGKPKQAMGNAVERAGKNLSFVRSYMSDEDITPYIVFGDGCDFEEGKSIRGRIFAMNDGGELNKIYVGVWKANNGRIFRPVSMFFRKKEWLEPEMRDLLMEIAKQSLSYYFQKYDA